MFTGLSSLRKAEKKEPTPQNKALQEYLKKYADGPGAAGEDGEKKKRKKKKPKPAGAGAINILDADVTGLESLPDAAPQALQRAQEADDVDDDEPVIANPEEAEALKLQIEKSKNFYQPGEGGSGWVASAAEQQQQRQLRRRHDSPAAGSGSDRDVSPPGRGRQRHDTPPPHTNGTAAAAGSRGRKRSLSPGDVSPPRRGRQRHDSPAAAAGGGRGGGSPDLSPPRRGRQRHDSPADASPPRRRRHDSPEAAAAAGRGGVGSPDLSPPRRGRQRHDSPEAAAAARGTGRRGGSPDLSPPRRGRQRHDSPADASPPRRRRHDSPEAAAAAPAGRGRDLSPPRRPGQRHDFPDASPPRRHRHDSPADASPPRRRPRSSSPGAAAVPCRPPAAARMGDGTSAGLLTSAQLAQETAKLRAQAEERRRAAGGKGEATVYRDKVTGKVISAEEYAEQQAKAKQKKAPPEEIHVAWKGGLAQQRAAMEAAQRAAKEASKAFARGFDDDADVELRDRNRWGDPMAGKLKKKRGGGDEFDLAPPVITEANRAMMEASGFVVPQEVPPHSWLRRGVAAPVNRYNLRPGRHWDGVDRSNGFEKEMFKMINQKNAQELEARMWAQEDM